ncbi:MAG TPA: PilZ domain-containing protein [Candidatus Angelobacter sp.]|nr:PilZ domain-containing protein [Candidatus Angelobacter sp.]
MVEQRRTPRFELRLPLRIMRTGAGRVSQDALTRNISSGGVLFTSETDVPIGGAIEYVVTLSAEGSRHVDLRCFGKVVRLEKSPSQVQNDAYLIAATLDRYQFVRCEA